MRPVEEQFYTEKMHEILECFRVQLIKKFLANEQILKQRVHEVLSQLSEVVNPNTKIAYIDFSLLQVSFLSEKYEILVEAYGESWYLESLGHRSMYVGELFEELHAIKTQWMQEIKRYVGKIRPYCIDYYLLKQLAIYNEYFTYFMMQWLKQWDEDLSFRTLDKAPILKVNWGDYKNRVNVVYLYEEGQKAQEDFEQRVEKEEQLIDSQWRNIKLDSIQIQNKDLTCANFKGATFKNAKLTLCVLAAANFKQSMLCCCHFDQCDLRLIDFTESVLEKVTFKDCLLEKVNFKGALFKKVTIIEGDRVIESNGMMK